MCSSNNHCTTARQNAVKFKGYIAPKNMFFPTVCKDRYLKDQLAKITFLKWQVSLTRHSKTIANGE